jgi:hypothetical protein
MSEFDRVSLLVFGRTLLLCEVVSALTEEREIFMEEARMRLYLLSWKARHEGLGYQERQEFFALRKYLFPEDA